MKFVTRSYSRYTANLVGSRTSFRNSRRCKKAGVVRKLFCLRLLIKSDVEKKSVSSIQGYRLLTALSSLVRGDQGRGHVEVLWSLVRLPFFVISTYFFSLCDTLIKPLFAPVKVFFTEAHNRKYFCEQRKKRSQKTVSFVFPKYLKNFFLVDAVIGHLLT